MYLDSYVIASLVIVVLTCVVLGYMGVFAWRHIKQDVSKSQNQNPDAPKK